MNKRRKRALLACLRRSVFPAILLSLIFLMISGRWGLVLYVASIAVLALVAKSMMIDPDERIFGNDLEAYANRWGGIAPNCIAESSHDDRLREAKVRMNVEEWLTNDFTEPPATKVPGERR